MTRNGSVISEATIALAILFLFGFPVYQTSHSNVSQLARDQVRLGAEEICHNLLERFGRGRDNVAAWLEPGDSPQTLSATDPWEKNPRFLSLLGVSNIPQMVQKYQFSLTLTLDLAVSNGLDRLTATVTWLPPGRRQKERLTYRRHILHDHLH
jgi:hypothetical protein